MSLVKGQTITSDTGDEFIPIFTNLNNLNIAANYTAYYTRVGSIVTVFQRIYVEPVTNGTVSFTATLPIPTTYAGGFDLIGKMFDASGSVGCHMADNTAQVDITTPISSPTLVILMYSYKIR